MRYQPFEPLGRELSLLVLGTAVFEHAGYEESVPLLDAWLEAGGNAIDTGRQYGNAEAIIGRWLRERDAYDRVVVITKIGHHDEVTLRPRLTRADLAEDFEGSRRELGLDAIDVLLLHRDDPARPVAAILDDLAAVTNGNVTALGGSNWATDRLEEAPGLVCSSPNLSLAVANEPPWHGCVSILRGDDEAWYARTRLPVFAWQALAGGFFAGSATADVDRIYGSADNNLRRERAQKLARARGATVSQVALAWSLAQPYPVFAIVGPRTPAELDDCVEALELELTQTERDRLDLRD